MEFITKLFRGRANRKYYFLHYILAITITLMVTILPFLVTDLGSMSQGPIFSNNFWVLGTGWGLYFSLILLGFLTYIISLDYRRFQDLGYSGLLVLIKLSSITFFKIGVPLGLATIPLMGILGTMLYAMSMVIAIVLFLFPGQDKKNNYGVVPK